MDNPTQDPLQDPSPGPSQSPLPGPSQDSTTSVIELSLDSDSDFDDDDDESLVKTTRESAKEEDETDADLFDKHTKDEEDSFEGESGDESDVSVVSVVSVESVDSRDSDGGFDFNKNLKQLQSINNNDFLYYFITYLDSIKPNNIDKYNTFLSDFIYKFRNMNHNKLCHALKIIEKNCNLVYTYKSSDGYFYTNKSLIKPNGDINGYFGKIDGSKFEFMTIKSTDLTLTTFDIDIFRYCRLLNKLIKSCLK